MESRRYLFRGFYPNKNGNTTITVNGKNIQGEWIYWDEKGILVNPKNMHCKPIKELGEDGYNVFGIMVVDETISEYATRDKNGKDLFEGDRVIKQTILFGTIRGVITYDDKSTRYVMRMKNADMCDLTDVEYYDNIFEQKESDNG